MKKRTPRIQIFCASSIDKLNEKIAEYIDLEKICVGSYVDCKIRKLGGVYAIILITASAKEDRVSV